MRVGNKKKPDYGAISRHSVHSDFYSERIYIEQRKAPENGKQPKITIPKQEPAEEGEVKRIASINPICEYAKYARYFVGRLVRLKERKGVGDSTTGWYEFIHDEDRQAINQAAGWSDNKKKYLLERPKFK